MCFEIISAMSNKVDKLVQYHNFSLKSYFDLMYIIKVKGIAKIPDYVQLRDD